MINIVTALKIEAIPIIEYFNLKSTGEIYQNKEINLIITGSGKVKSAINTALLLRKKTYPTINIGIAGSNKHPIGSGFFIHKITDTDTGFEYYPDFFEEPSEEIFTVSKTQKYFSLVDMESSGFFEAAYKFLSVEKIILYKIVSDTPNQPFNKNTIPKLIEKSFPIIKYIIKNFQNTTSFTDIEEKIKNLYLTQTQKAKLKELLTYMQTKNIPFPDIPKTKNKKETQIFIEKLKKSLL
ncbi:MAG: hypothetical protein ABGX25_04450 [Nautiliaceae bacterium]